MSSPEQQFSTYLQFEFARTVVNLCASAIQVFMWIYMVSFYVEAQPEARRRRLPYIVASLAILLLSTSSSIVEGVYIYKVLFQVAPGPENVEAMLEIHDTYWTRLLSPAGLVWDIAIRIADAVLAQVYRCYVVWFDLRWVVALPAAILLAGIGVSLRTYIPLDFEDRKLDTADLCLTVGLNILITILILFRLVQAQKRFETVLPYTNHKVYLRIITFLAESAAPAAIFGAGSVITVPFIETSPRAWTANLLTPQLIIFRVATGTSWAHTRETSSVFSRPLEFAGQAQSAFDKEESSYTVADHRVIWLRGGITDGAGEAEHGYSTIEEEFLTFIEIMNTLPIKLMASSSCSSWFTVLI
ncbi:hypothetical protein BKA70DRAFT_1238639 [Coprinopsis sp. MPI-PUGE-AT-0042]|nr:hypothetical protein BKA70DRAFT_1238639 [Coprinopsis sp. MPI-PUGE-AT-0042]